MGYPNFIRQMLTKSRVLYSELFVVLIICNSIDGVIKQL